MKAKHVILYFLVSIIISSCIRDEALNAEADILSCTLPKAVMTTSPIINNSDSLWFRTNIGLQSIRASVVCSGC